MEKATFGAGCFWGVEEAFRKIPGVITTAVGYAGGSLDSPSYEDVCTDETGHAEVVEVDFDSDKVTYEQLLKAFFGIHDPTTLNRQGPDIGSQYRSVVFYHSKEQQEKATDLKNKLNAKGHFKHPIVTEISPAKTFWRAEEYHQQYFHKRGLPSCHIPTPIDL